MRFVTPNYDTYQGSTGRNKGWSYPQIGLDRKPREWTGDFRQSGRVTYIIGN